MAFVDIIIPAYNAASFLPKALDSVEAQTFRDWRILLVDDGSRDHTSVVVAPYQQRLGEKLLYIRKDNAGLPAARNTAIQHATAEFLAILDADDVWLPNRLESTLAPFRNRPEVGLVYGFVSRIDANDRVVEVHNKRNAHAEGRVAPYIYMRMLDLPCPTVTFRRKCVEEVGVFDETLRATEDRDLWLRIAQRYEVALAPEIVAYYRISPGGMTKDSDRMLRAQRQFIQKHYGTPGCGWRERRVALSWIYRQRAETLADLTQRSKALGSALRAFLYYPFQQANARVLASVLLRWLGFFRNRHIDATRNPANYSNAPTL